MPATHPEPDLVRALAAELARRTKVSWLRFGGRTQPVWHVWSDWSGGALCLVAGGTEQPLPDIPDGATVEVVMRSGDTGGRVLTWEGRADVVRPGDEGWAPTTTALVAARLNVADPATAADTWADDPAVVVRRVTPLR